MHGIRGVAQYGTCFYELNFNRRRENGRLPATDHALAAPCSEGPRSFALGGMYPEHTIFRKPLGGEWLRQVARTVSMPAWTSSVVYVVFQKCFFGPA